MFAGGLLLSMTLIGFAIWLQWNEQVGWPGEAEATDDERDYRTRRARSRRRVNALFLLCGVAVLVATLATPRNGAVWAACWLSVLATLVTILLLASLDTVRTLRHFRGKLDDRRRGRLS